MKKAAEGYRPDIDGLRALAILLVVFFHAFPSVCPGGFVGVSVFFVISGYLISGIILKRLERGRFSFLDFYARRSRRIVPALALTLLTVWLAGRYLLWADEFKRLGLHVFNSAFFTENIWLSNENNYFDVASDLKPLLHFWSLGIEEQFYLLWPIVLVAASRRGRRFGGLTLAGLGGASLLYRLLAPAHAQVDVFYLLPARFWELMLGGGLAWLELGSKKARKERAGLAAAALAAVVAFSFAIDPRHSSNPRAWLALSTLLPTLATFALIGSKGWINDKLLAHPALVLIGKISYPWYLWHWVLLAFARLHYSHISEVEAQAGPPLLGAVVLLSAVLAWLTYRLVELPVQLRLFASRPERARARSFVLAGLGALVLLGGLGLASNHGWLLTAEQKRQEKFLDAYDRFKSDVHARDQAYRNDCNFHLRPVIDPSCYTPTSPRRVFIWGDSHAQQLNSGLAAYLPKDFSLLQIASSLCPPSLQPGNGIEGCSSWNKFAFEKIKAARPDVVILAQDKDHEKTPWPELARALKEQAGVAHVIVVGPVPQWHPTLYQIIAHYYLEQVPPRLAHGIREDIFKTDAAMKARYANAADFTYVSVLDRLCDDKHACQTMAGPDLLNDLLTTDYGHLSLKGSELVARQVLGPVVTRAFSRDRSSTP